MLALLLALLTLALILALILVGTLLILLIGQVGTQNPEIVFRMLKKGFGQYPVAGALRIAGKNQIFVENLLRRSPDFYFGPVAIHYAARRRRRPVAPS